MPKQQSHRGERLQLMLSPEELRLLDDFRFAHRMPSRAAAIRELLRLGLASLDDETAVPQSKSSDFGVTSQLPEPSDLAHGATVSRLPTKKREG